MELMVYNGHCSRDIRLDILPDIGYDVIVASAFISLALNGLIYKRYAKVMV